MHSSDCCYTSFYTRYSMPKRACIFTKSKKAHLYRVNVLTCVAQSLYHFLPHFATFFSKQKIAVLNCDFSRVIFIGITVPIPSLKVLRGLGHFFKSAPSASPRPRVPALPLKLHLIKVCVGSVFGKKGIMCSLLLYAVLGQHDYPLCVADGGKSVSYYKSGAVMCQLFK